MVRTVTAVAFVNPCAFFMIAGLEVEVIAGLSLGVVPNAFVWAPVLIYPGMCVAN